MDVLDLRASVLADRVAFTLLRQGEVESGELSFGELRRRAVAMAAQLSVLAAPGDRALLLYAQGLEFIVAFFACLYAGVVAVPVSAPNRRRGLQALAGIAGDCGAKWIFSNGPLLDQLSEDIAQEADFPAVRCLDPEQLAEATAADWSAPALAPDSLALLQYTSGSTGSPRGVAVTHANLVDNHEQMRLSFAHDETTVIVSWLPMFHDMGLGTIVMTVWAGAHCVLMSPSAFVQHPRRWLAAISRYRATTSLAPDFAYDLCTRRIGPHEREGLDLSSWRAAVNGSEPVRASTLQRFTETFGPWGFRWKAFQAGYGLAEATLFVSSAHPSEPPVVREFSAEALARGEVAAPDKLTRGQALVSCGRTWGTTQIAIVNPDTSEECPSNRVGEIWVSGGSVAAGYWGRGAANEAIFAAVTSAGRGPFLRTGDLGFVDDGHLFVTGRHKDLVIIRGRNHYPQDIEQSVSTSHPALVPHGCAAFSIDSAQGEQLVIVQEVVRTALRTLDTPSVVRAIRAVISEQHALHTHAVVLLKPSTLPRTTSGKVRRKLCRQAFLDNTLPAMASWVAPMSPIPDTDTHPDSAQREASSRADRLIEWLRRHAADLISSFATEERRTVPPGLLRHLAKQGLLGMQVAPQYGGLGLGHSDLARVIEQLAAFDFGLALFVGLNNYLGIQPIAKHAGQQLKGLLLPGLVHGEEVAAFAFAEPGAAAANVVTAEAKLDGEERWRLFGSKYLDGVVQGATVINVFAQHDEPPGISSFVVLEGVEGLRPVRDGLSMGLLGFTRETIALDGAGVGRENLLGSLGSGLEIAREAMMHTRLSIAAACIGGMKRCAQLVSRDGPYAGTIQGKLTPNPVILSRLGSVTARVTALECLVHRLTRAIDAGHTPPSEAFAACKIIGPEMLLRSVDDLMQLGVQASYAETNRLSSLYRDAGLLRNFDGLPEAVAERMGAQLLAGDASLRLLIGEVLGAPDVVQWISPVMEVVRHRMTNLTGALARRPERWANTRAGELATWLVLVAAVDASRRAASGVELERAYAWAKAQFEQALASVRFGTPSETATLDKSDIAATFASYARSIGDVEPPPAIPSASASALRAPASAATPHATSGQQPPAPYASEVSRRELRAWLISWLAHRLQIPVAEVDAARSFADHGLDSVAAVELATALSEKLGRELDATLLWNFATIDALVEYVVSSATAKQAVTSDEHATALSPRAPSDQTETLEDELARLERELSSRS